jgi:hypothetical protein
MITGSDCNQSYTGTEQIRVILHAKRLGPADQVPIEHVFTIENHIVPLDRADVLECVLPVSVRDI